MTTYFISRHAGAIEWLTAKGYLVDQHLEHLDDQSLHPGDRVVGTLPVNLAASVCAAGAQYVHLTLNLPKAWRGRELSADDMVALGARLEVYQVKGPFIQQADG